MLALPVATGLFVSIGYVIGAVGAVPAVVMCALLSLVALLQNKLFAELAAMFPDKSGGVATFAIEAWKRYFTPLGSVAAFGYWLGWASVMSLLGLTIGSLIQAQWFPSQTWTLFTVAGVSFGFPQCVSVVALVASTLLNVRGIQSAARVNQVVGVGLITALVVIAAGPFISGQWHAAELSSHVEGGWKTFVVWLYVSAWAIYGTEICAIFAPEYRDTAKDTSRALNSIALVMVAAYTLVPLSTAGQLGDAVIAENPVTYGVASVTALSPSLSSVITAVLCAGLFTTMVSASADAGRSLYGLSGEKMTLRQFGRLSRRGVPANALLVTLLVNLLVLVFIGNPVSILLASNLGYLLAITLAVIGFILLRRDRPSWPRPIKRSRVWLPIAGVVAVFNGVLIAVGVTNAGVSNAAGLKDVLLGVLLLSLGVVMFLWRSIVQEKGPLRLQDRSTDEPAVSINVGGDLPASDAAQQP